MVEAGSNILQVCVGARPYKTRIYYVLANWPTFRKDLAAVFEGQFAFTQPHNQHIIQTVAKFRKAL